MRHEKNTTKTKLKQNEILIRETLKIPKVAKIKIINKGTLMLVADNKQNYPERKTQVITQNMAIEPEIASNKIKTNNII